jgi:hypothetical protein
MPLRLFTEILLAVDLELLFAESCATRLQLATTLPHQRPVSPFDLLRVLQFLFVCLFAFTVLNSAKDTHQLRFQAFSEISSQQYLYTSLRGRLITSKTLQKHHENNYIICNGFCLRRSTL